MYSTGLPAAPGFCEPLQLHIDLEMTLLLETSPRSMIWPLTSKAITDLLLLFFVQLRVASPFKKNCLRLRLRRVVRYIGKRGPFGFDLIKASLTFK